MERARLLAALMRVAYPVSVAMEGVLPQAPLVPRRLSGSLACGRRVFAHLVCFFQSVVDGVFLTDGEGNVLRMNAAAEDMLDTAEEDAYGRPFVQVTRDHELWLVLREALAGKRKPSATVEHGLELHEEFLTLMQSKGTLTPDEDRLEDGIAFAGVSRFPARVKCALLGWSAFKDAALRTRAGEQPSDQQDHHEGAAR